MSITVLQALLITLFCIISNLMFPLLGDIGGYFGLGRPLIAGTITGLILGDVKTGMMIGASLNAVYMSSQAVGNVMSTDVTMAGYIATALSMAGSNDPAMALALSIPIGLFGSMLFTMQNAVCVFFSHKCDEYAAKGQVKKMWLVGIGIPLVVFNVIRAIPTFLIGFLAYSVFGISAVTLTILAICLAVIIDQTKAHNGPSAGTDDLAPLE